MARKSLVFAVVFSLGAAGVLAAPSVSEMADRVFNEYDGKLVTRFTLPCDLAEKSFIEARDDGLTVSKANEVPPLVYSRFETKYGPNVFFRFSLEVPQQNCDNMESFSARVGVNREKQSIIRKVSSTVFIVDWFVPDCAGSGALTALCQRMIACGSRLLLAVPTRTAFEACITPSQAPSAAPTNSPTFTSAPTSAPTFNVQGFTMGTKIDDGGLPVLPVVPVTAQYKATIAIVDPTTAPFTNAGAYRCLAQTIIAGTEGGFFEVPKAGGKVRICQNAGRPSLFIGFNGDTGLPVQDSTANLAVRDPVPFCNTNTAVIFTFPVATVNYKVYLGTNQAYPGPTENVYEVRFA